MSKAKLYHKCSNFSYCESKFCASIFWQTLRMRSHLSLTTFARSANRETDSSHVLEALAVHINGWKWRKFPPSFPTTGNRCERTHNSKYTSSLARLLPRRSTPSCEAMVTVFPRSHTNVLLCCAGKGKAGGEGESSI